MDGIYKEKKEKSSLIYFHYYLVGRFRFPCTLHPALLGILESRWYPILPRSLSSPRASYPRECRSELGHDPPASWSTSATEGTSIRRETASLPRCLQVVYHDSKRLQCTTELKWQRVTQHPRRWSSRILQLHPHLDFRSYTIFI